MNYAVKRFKFSKAMGSYWIVSRSQDSQNTGIFGKEVRLFGTSRYMLGIMVENILAEVIAD